MAFTKQDLRNVLIRGKARAFSMHLRAERWAENIPEEDQKYLQSGEEIKLYKEYLISFGCVMRNHDFKWEAKA